jgi:arylsulfatase A-like enzyme
MDAVKRIFDGYDVGIRYADDHVGVLLDRLAGLGVLDDTTVLLSSDHGEGFGELGVYADHQAADQATAHIPAIVRGPGIPAGVDASLHYHLDVGATLLEHAGIAPPEPDVWDGVSFAPALHDGRAEGRPYLVTSQGAWSCQRGVRFGEHLYLRTWHDGFHDWPERMLFDVEADPHEQHDLAGEQPLVAAEGARLLEAWHDEQLQGTPDLVDPMSVVLAEGGPYHVRGHLAAYLERLRATGRGHLADALAERHPDELLSDRQPNAWLSNL